jgi:hypothetical protein
MIVTVLELQTAKVIRPKNGPQHQTLPGLRQETDA